MAQRESRTIRATAPAADFQRAVAAWIDSPVAHATVLAGAEAANVRRLTLQVRDRLGMAWKERWLVWLYLTTTPGGDPGGAQAVAFVTGTVLETILPNQQWRVLTDGNGSLSLDVDAGAGAQTRYAAAIVLGAVNESAAITWT